MISLVEKNLSDTKCQEAPGRLYDQTHEVIYPVTDSLQGFTAILTFVH